MIASTAKHAPALVVQVGCPLAEVLSRLDRVRKCGGGYIARCPAHEDKTASLSIAAGADGRVLLHCFAGCAAADVVGTVGMTVAELFIREPTAEMTFSERAALRERARHAQWTAALNALGLEVTIALLGARDVAAGKPLIDEDLHRLATACQRIEDAKEVFCGRRN